MNLEQVKKLNIPTTPGCYQYFDKAGRLLYIGKAANLKARVFSYWRTSAGHTAAKEKMVAEIDKIKIIMVDSEIEALLLEANLIKKFQPPYNIIMRDDKRHQYIKITDDEYPRVVATRNIDKSGRYFGPFTSGSAVRETLKAIGKIFPYGRFATMPENKSNQLKSRRYPEIYGAPADRGEYKKIIKEIIKFLEGKRRGIEKQIQLQIKNYKLRIKKNKNQEIEEKIKKLKYRLLNMRNVLAHANVLSVHDKYAADVVELAKILGLPKIPQRIEGYDISNLFGQNAVGSMVVFAGGESDKKEYRKFKIKGNTPLSARAKNTSPFPSPYKGEGSGAPFPPAKKKIEVKFLPLLTKERAGVRFTDDTAALKEILERRFNNSWPLPDLIIIDGGRGQLNAGLGVLKKIGLSIPIIAISKGEGLRSAHAPDKIFFPNETRPLQLPLASPALHIIKRVRDEAHRFAIGFHHQKRTKNWLEK